MPMSPDVFELRAVGYVESEVADIALVPRQPDEGAPPARLRFDPAVRPALASLKPGDQILVLTWLHLADRQTLVVHPRDDLERVEAGVFSTRSADRPNPIGIHQTRITAIDDLIVDVEHLEAIDGTPIVDIKPVLRTINER